MAGDWIKMRNDLAEDPAVIGIAHATGLDEFAVVGRLHSLWSWADRQSRNGHAEGVTLVWLNRYLHCDKFAEVLISVGWLAVDNHGLTIPNFDRHNGQSAKARGLAADRQRKKRLTGLSRIESDESVTREEKSIRLSKDKRIATPKENVNITKQVMLASSETLSDETATQYLAYRKAKRAPLTKRAWETICKEIKAAGISCEQGLSEAMARGWQGFKAEWYNASSATTGRQNGTPPPSKNWWESWPGIVAKGKELGLEQRKEEQAPYFKLRVFQAAGTGPWSDAQRDTTQSYSPRPISEIVQPLNQPHKIQ